MNEQLNIKSDNSFFASILILLLGGLGMLLISYYLISCNQRSNDTKQIDAISQPNNLKPFPTKNVFHEKFEDEFKTTIDSTYPCQLTNPDTSVYGIILNDRKGSIKHLGEKFETIEDNLDMPHETFCSQDKSQTLTVFFHYGNYRNAFSEFQVKEFSTNDTATILSTKSFVTNSGIKLGLTKEKLISILGKCYKNLDTKGKTDTIIYRVYDFSNSVFLQRFNMPSYYAEYEFRDERLIRFRFGFEYP